MTSKSPFPQHVIDRLAGLSPWPDPEPPEPVLLNVVEKDEHGRWMLTDKTPQPGEPVFAALGQPRRLTGPADQFHMVRIIGKTPTMWVGEQNRWVRGGEAPEPTPADGLSTAVLAALERHFADSPLLDEDTSP